MKTILIFLFMLSAVFNLNGQNKDYTSWWMDVYGDYKKLDGKHDPRVKWVDTVFERVRNVADKAKSDLPRLFIINSVTGVCAVSLPDGGIIINPKTLDTCYNDTGRETGDRRMAFILGHELAHLANNDYIHQQAFLVLEKWGSKKARKELAEFFNPSGPGEETRDRKERELMADKSGALYASMAGFDVGKLFLENNNFITHWAGQTGVGMLYDDDPLHPTLNKRLLFIQSHLNAIPHQLELFNAGVLLYQVGSYHDGAAAFQEFVKLYPAREVYNNIGACYLHLALRHLFLKSGKDYFMFRLSTIIDNSTSAETLHTTRGDYLKDKDFLRYIGKAEDYLRRAAAADKLDRACRYNLAAVLILKKEYAEAQALCNQVLKEHPEDVFALNNKAVAFYYYGKEEGLDTTQKAIESLEEAHRLGPENAEVLYNLASLKQDRNRLAGAKIYWEKYLNQPATPRDNYYSYIHKMVNGTVPSNPGASTETPRIPGGIKLGDPIAPIREKWGKRNSRSYKLGNEESGDSESWYLDLQVIVKKDVRVVALDGTVEIVEFELSPVEGIPGVLKRFGPPQKVVRHSAGSFYIYEDRGFSIKEVNGKAHSYIRFQKTF